MTEAKRIAVDFCCFRGGYYEEYERKPNRSSLCGFHTVLERDKNGQCLAAPHTHISTLKPDQLTHFSFRECYIRNMKKILLSSEKSAIISKTPVIMIVTSHKRGLSKLEHYRCGSDWKNESAISRRGVLMKRYSK